LSHLALGSCLAIGSSVAVRAPALTGPPVGHPLLMSPHVNPIVSPNGFVDVPLQAELS